MDRPPSPERLVPVSFRPHRRSSNMRRSPIWTARAYLRNRAETGRLPADHGRQDKSAASGRAHVVGWIGDFRRLAHSTCWRFRQKRQDFNAPSAISGIGECDSQAMTTRDDDFNPRPGRIHHGNQGAKRPKSFVGEVMRAAKKAGHRGQTFRRSGGTARPFDLRPRTAGGAVPGLPIVRPARRRHGPDRAPPWRPISFGAALEACRLPEARRRDPRRRRCPDVRRQPPTTPTRRLSPNGARRTGIISGSQSLRRTRASLPTFGPSRAS